tara:strand:+ start:2048 stop:2317 length:270 start_codon:yes stop_codon:yes gene_type:complete
MKILNENILLTKVKNDDDKSGLDFSMLRDDSDRYHKGKIYDFGEFMPEIIKKNLLVYYDKNRGSSITINGNNYILIRYEDIVVIDEANI